MYTQKVEYTASIEKLQEENKETLMHKNKEIDKNLKIEEIVDEKNERIVQLEKEVQRKNDEINCRKEMIDAMSASLMSHEKESQ